jgi:hypothetical protein
MTAMVQCAAYRRFCRNQPGFQADVSNNGRRSNLAATKPILGWRHLRMVVDEFNPGIKKSGNLEMRYCS